ncbi:MAG: bifunctional oligoribonuclease/PAP phosphatase NrnA [Firmicutes bacterium]|nr:bifunctional oligoribonuclease/PAP phosphatase NrnA [Bacillota bacterium]
MTHDFSKVTEKLLACRAALIFTHVNMDGDAVGSSAALCLAMRKLGKECYILKEDKLGDYLRFLVPEGLFTDLGADGSVTLPGGSVPYSWELSIAVDMGSDSRLERRKDAFYSAPASVCVDHHPAQGEFADCRVVDRDCPAAALLVYELIKELNVEIDREMADLLYAGIITDTGSFKYENSGPEAHRAAAELIELGARYELLSLKLLDTHALETLRVEDTAMERAETVCGGRGIVSYITLADLEHCGARPENAETAIDRLRVLKTAELAAVLKEREPGVYKLSARSKLTGLARELALRFGGGGHAKASGATLEMPLEQAYGAVKAACEELLESAEESL